MVDVTSTLAGFGSGAMTFIFVMAIMLVIGMVGFAILWAALHKIKIRVHSQTGSKTLVVKTYKAREQKKDGTTQLKPLNPFDKWITIEIKPPNQPGTWYYEKNKKVLNVYKTGNGSYVYIKFEKNKGEDPRYGIVDEDMKAWVAMQLRQTETKYAVVDWMSKYGPTVSIGLVGMIFIVGLVIISNMIPG